MNVTERCGQKQNGIERGRTAAKIEKTDYCLLKFHEGVQGAIDGKRPAIFRFRSDSPRGFLFSIEQIQNKGNKKGFTLNRVNP
jgi:hypothetical protein